MSKFWNVTFASVLLMGMPAVASAAGAQGAHSGTRAVAVQSTPQLPSEAAQLLTRNGESASLIGLGSLFIGAAVLFSARRSNV